tara:strand:+ start:1285 stop:1425 length:141 start_codon:yes stop_codon:yes gene_type:complete
MASVQPLQRSDKKPILLKQHLREVLSTSEKERTATTKGVDHHAVMT